MRYFGRNPFLSPSSAWTYIQGIADFSLAGYFWDPRFLEFELGGNFNYTSYGGTTESPDNDFVGYRMETRFFPKSKLSFGLRYSNDDMGTVRKAETPSALRYAQREKGFDLSLSRVKYLPSIRMSYAEKEYRSSVSDSTMKEKENRANLDLNHAVGISSFDFNYRRERYENQSIERNRSYENLRATERLQLGSGMSVWVEGLLTKNTIALPAGRSYVSSFHQFSANALGRLSGRLRGSVRYAYVDNAVDGRNYAMHAGQASFHYAITDHLTLSPLFSFSRNAVEDREMSDVIKDAQAGARLTWDGARGAFSWRTDIELSYRLRQALDRGRAKGWTGAFGTSFSLGNPQSVLGSLGYNYSGSEIDSSIPDRRDPFFDFGLGTNLNRHSVRFDLRNRALRPLDMSLYTRYDTYERILSGQAPMDTAASHVGLNLSLGGGSASADLGTDEMATGAMSARYRTFTSTLDYALTGSIALRAQLIQRKRRDEVMGGEFHRNISFFLNMTIALFKASLIYQNIAWEFDGPVRRDEIISLTMTRSFGTRR